MVACDSFTSQGDVILDPNTDKRLVVNGVWFFLSGDATQETIEKLVVGYFEKEVSEYDTDRVAQACALVYDKSKGFFGKMGFNGDGSLWTYPMTIPFAIGSGSPYAFGAMDAGASAAEAVKVASSRDPFTGGKIRKYKIKINN